MCSIDNFKRRSKKRQLLPQRAHGMPMFSAAAIPGPPTFRAQQGIQWYIRHTAAAHRPKRAVFGTTLHDGPQLGVHAYIGRAH